VPWFWQRDETLNEQLLREAGYSSEGTPTDAAEPAPEAEGEPVAPTRNEQLAAPRPRDASVVATTEVPALTRDSYEFTTLPDGSMIVDDSCEEDLSALADAVEEHVKRPYRASATRHEDDVWVVAARPIDVARLTAHGDELELTSVAGERSYTVDGGNVAVALAPAQLVALGKRCSADYAVHAVRLDGELWEVEADPL
jgi:hypothetical protein